MLSKPKPAQTFVVLGVLFQFLGAIIFAIALPQTFGYYGSSAAFVWVFIGAFVLLLGLIFLLVGISRAAGGIDYLVAIAPAAEKPAPIATSSASVAPEAPAVTGASL
jgi:hypothetical protein